MRSCSSPTLNLINPILNYTKPSTLKAIHNHGRVPRESMPDPMHLSDSSQHPEGLQLMDKILQHPRYLNPIHYSGHIGIITIATVIITLTPITGIMTLFYTWGYTGFLHQRRSAACRVACLSANWWRGSGRSDPESYLWSATLR